MEGLCSSVWTSSKNILLCGVGSQHLKLKIRRKKKSRKIVTSLAYIFTMEKALVKIIFGHKIFICRPIFKTFVALFTTRGVSCLFEQI